MDCLLSDYGYGKSKTSYLLMYVPVQSIAQVSLLVTLHDVLAEYGLCCAGKDSEGGEGAFLKMSIKHLGALEVRLKPQITNKSPVKACKDEKEILIDDDVMIIEKPSPRPIELNDGAAEEKSVVESKEVISIDDEGQDVESVDIEKKREELGIDYALDQSFFCLYGLNLRGEATGSEGLMDHQNTNRGDYKTREQCAGVLQYILPYAKACSVRSPYSYLHFITIFTPWWSNVLWRVSVCQIPTPFLFAQ